MNSALSTTLSIDQVAAFVELARQGTLRRAAEGLLITEQGVRNRLLALERGWASSYIARAAARAGPAR